MTRFYYHLAIGKDTFVPKPRKHETPIYYIDGTVGYDRLCTITNGERKFEELMDWDAIKKSTLDNSKEHPDRTATSKNNSYHKIHVFGNTPYIQYGSMDE